MPRINVNLEGDGAFADMKELVDEGKLIIIPDESTIDIAVLEDGTVSGEPSIAFRFHRARWSGCIRTDDNETLPVECSFNPGKVS